MKKQLVYAAAMLLGICSCKQPEPQMVLEVNLDSREAEVPESMYGIFFEEINHAGDGGLYGEMLMNRSFEERVIPEGYMVENNQLVAPTVINHTSGRPASGRYRWGSAPYPGWELSATATARAAMSLTTEQPNFASAPTSMKVTVNEKGNGVALVNKGYWGIALQKEAAYNLRMFMRSNADAKEMTVRLLGPADKELGKAVITLNNDNKWQEYKATIQATDTTTAGRLAIELPNNGTYFFDYVSLFPQDTYKGRENGMRKDVAEMIEGLRPAFIRWPGGCIVEGITLNNRVEWKKTLGDPAARPGQYDAWGYRNTYGFGYKEFLDFCEDVGAKGMYVCNVGIACQARTGEACSDKEAEAYLQDALDAIEYAIGGTDTKWGAVRASEGHPAPYPLAYVEIGNENWGKVYDSRFNMFYDAIKAKYPQLTLISNHGLNGIGEARKTDMIDPHWYVAPDFFFNNTTIFDNHERGKYKIYVGEYACNQGVGGGNMLAALSEAAFITGMERNSDLVTMASYAPLFENKNDRGWPTNLIWISNNQVLGRSSYYVQKMFAENRPTYNLKISGKTLKQEIEPLIKEKGYIGFGTWGTQTQFRNLSVTDSTGAKITADMTDSTQWNRISGEWQMSDGVYTQSSNANRTALLWNKAKAGIGDIIEFEVQKLSGNEGFFAYFGMKELNLNDGYMLNAGGWNNTATAIETVKNNNSNVLSDRVNDKIEAGRWYKVKIVLKEHGADYFIDGKPLLTHTNKPVSRRFYIAGYDETSNEVIIKVVNATVVPCIGQINIKGGDVERKGRVITLSSKTLQDENSFEEPTKISPVETEYNKFSSSFTYEFKPNSFTILRMKKK